MFILNLPILRKSLLSMVKYSLAFPLPVHLIFTFLLCSGSSSIIRGKIFTNLAGTVLLYGTLLSAGTTASILTYVFLFISFASVIFSLCPACISSLPLDPIWLLPIVSAFVFCPVKKRLEKIKNTADFFSCHYLLLSWLFCFVNITN